MRKSLNKRLHWPALCVLGRVSGDLLPTVLESWQEGKAARTVYYSGNDKRK